MSVTLLVTFDELPEADRVARYTEQQSESLLALEEKYRTDVAARLPASEREQHGPDSRHFWYNGEFQVHKDRFIHSISGTSVVALNFRRDTYLVSTPRRSEVERCIDPELTVSELIDYLHRKNEIGAVCCYEVLDSKGAMLKPDKTLAQQNALPYADPLKKQESHLRVRMQRHIVRNAAIFMFLSAFAGCILGWLVHHRLVQ